jgi:hypothetical protein
VGACRWSNCHDRAFDPEPVSDELRNGTNRRCGVELVTISLSLEDHLARSGWQKVLNPLRSIAKSGSGTENCGMHVHINKAALSPLQIGKMLVFLNSTVLRDQITTIAQRESNVFCTRSVRKFTDGRGLSEHRHDVANVGHIRLCAGTQSRWDRRHV